MKKLVLFVLVVLLAGCDGLLMGDVSIELQPGKDIIVLGEQWVDGGCLLVDNGLSKEFVTNDSIDSSIVGETLITYSTIHDNTAYICRRIVKVIDDVAPYGQLEPGIDTIYVGDTFIDGGVTGSDNYSETVEITIENNVDTTTAGVYQVLYTITDEAGNETIITRMVHVLTEE